MNIILKNKKKIIIEKCKEFDPLYFSIEEQCDMILSHDFSPLKRLINKEKLSDEAVDYFINIGIRDFISYLDKIEFIKSHLLNNDNKSDGLWIKVNSDDTFNLINQERGNVFINNIYKTKEILLSKIALLILYKIPKFKNLYPNDLL